MNYTLTGIKTFRGMEGYGVNATIRKDGVPVAFVMDDANGGMVDFDFTNPLQTPASYRATTKEQAKAEAQAFGAFCVQWYKDTGREEAFRQQMKELMEGHPVVGEAVERESASAQQAMESWVGAMVDAHEEAKMLARHAKTKTLFRLKGDEEGAWRSIKSVRNPAVVTHLRTKYGDKLERIYGEADAQ